MGPNDHPNIPAGLATKIGQLVGAGFALVAAVTAVLNGDHSQETITAMAVSGAVFVALIVSRGAQAAAWYAARRR